MSSAETRVTPQARDETGLPATLAVLGQAPAPRAGFAGVRLAVAFCSFVI